MIEEERQEREAFLEVYEKIRFAEGWGGEDLDLPFRPLRNKDIWAIRRRSFQKFQAFVFSTWSEAGRRGKIAVDVGAGNCWLTRYLSAWGFAPAALDISVSRVDGLMAGRSHPRLAASCDRIRASMEVLPFGNGTVDLVVANAACHYTRNLTSMLREFRRVLTADGRIVVIDSPFYKNADDGERMLNERVNAYRETYGAAEYLLRRVSYFTYDGFKKSAHEAEFECSIQSVWPGMRRTYEKMRGRLLGRHIAEFPMAILRPR